MPSDGAMADLAARLIGEASAPRVDPFGRRTGGHRARFERLAGERRWIEAFRIAFRVLTPPHVRPAMRMLAIDTVLAVATDEAAFAAIAGLVNDERVATVAGGFHLMAAAAAGRPPELDRASALAWASSLMWIMEDCEPELLRRMFDPLMPLVGRWPFFADLDKMLTSAPPRRPDDRFRDRTHAPMQLALAGGTSDTLLVGIAGRVGRIGMPIKLFHRWAAECDAHILYLRADPAGSYPAAIPDLIVGATPATGFVRAVADALGVARIGVYGNSASGFPGAALGLRVGARRITVAAGSTQAEEMGKPKRRTPEEWEAARRGLARDIGALVAQADGRSEILCVHSAGNGNDRGDAAALAGIPGVRVQAFPGTDHNVARQLTLTGALGPMLAWTAGRRAVLDTAAFGISPAAAS